jgi:hypothetical protein
MRLHLEAVREQRLNHPTALLFVYRSRCDGLNVIGLIESIEPVWCTGNLKFFQPERVRDGPYEWCASDGESIAASTIVRAELVVPVGRRWLHRTHLELQGGWSLRGCADRELQHERGTNHAV